jgi:hypothetical protein
VGVACRAGTTTCFNDGDTAANVSGDNANTNAWLDALGRYKFNGGYVNGTEAPAAGCSPANGSAIVGSYLRMRGGCTIRTGTCGSGAWTGTRARFQVAKIRWGRRRGCTAFIGRLLEQHRVELPFGASVLLRSVLPLQRRWLSPREDPALTRGRRRS